MVILFLYFLCFPQAAPDISCHNRKKAPSGKASKVAFDDTAKHLFEDGEWARNDVTMERVERSVVVYSFLKDGQVRE